MLWVNWDGSPRDLIAPMLAAGKLPNLQQMQATGVVADHAETVRPSLTAASFASLWTGTVPARHGITGNTIPRPRGSVAGGVTGFSAEFLVAEPIWTALARQGATAVAIDATQTYPLAIYAEGGRFGGTANQPHPGRQRLVNGYAYRILSGSTMPLDSEPLSLAEVAALAPAAVRGGELQPHGWRWPLRPDGSNPGDWNGPDHLLMWRFDDPEIVGTGHDALALQVPTGDPGRRELVRLAVAAANPAAIKTGRKAGPIPPEFTTVTLNDQDGPLEVYVRCWNIHGDGRSRAAATEPPLCYRPVSARNTTADADLAGRLSETAPGFVGNGGSGEYVRGAFGETLAGGGDGTAEARYLETVALTIANQTARAVALASQNDYDLLIGYLPYPDEAVHTWWGVVSKRSAAYDAALAERVRPHLEQVVIWVDRFLGALRDAAGKDVTTFLTSDHGHAAVSRAFRPNRVLEAAGLLGTAPAGNRRRLDLTRTQVVYHHGNGGYLLINGVDRDQGIVPPSERQAVSDAAISALLAARDPETGAQIVTAIACATEEPELAGPNAGDLYLDVLPQYELRADLEGPVAGSYRPMGAHRFDPKRPDIHTIFAAAGPGIRSGVEIGRVRNIDVAATITQLLGLRAPLQSSGEPITTIYADSEPEAERR